MEGLAGLGFCRWCGAVRLGDGDWTGVVPFSTGRRAGFCFRVRLRGWGWGRVYGKALVSYTGNVPIYLFYMLI